MYGTLALRANFIGQKRNQELAAGNQFQSASAREEQTPQEGLASDTHGQQYHPRYILSFMAESGARSFTKRLAERLNDA